MFSIGCYPFVAKSSLPFGRDRCSSHAGRRLAKASAEDAIEMGDIAKAGRNEDAPERGGAALAEFDGI